MKDFDKANSASCEAPTIGAPQRPQAAFDWQEWLPYLATLDGTDAQKREMIEALWLVVLSCIDAGYDVSARPEKSCGKPLDLNALLSRAVLNSSTPNDKKEEPR